MLPTTKCSQKTSPGARARLWPIPERPTRIHICDSELARYSIVYGIEAWDKSDPRGVAVFRCERHGADRAFPDLLLVERVPLARLNRKTRRQFSPDWACIFATAPGLTYLQSPRQLGSAHRRRRGLPVRAFPGSMAHSA